MKLKMLLGSAAAGVLFSMQAQAVSVAGVVWNPNSPLDFSSVTSNTYQSIDPITGESSGYGLITGVNGTPVGSFCPGCELTYTFSGFLPGAFGAIPTPGGSVIAYTGGVVDVYVDHTPDVPLSAYVGNFNAVTAANTGADADTQLFLSLAGAPDPGGVTFTGTSVPGLLSGLGQLDVTGGLAMANFDTNTQVHGSDLKFTFSFSNFPNDPSILIARGTGNFEGDTIPEPSTIALLGLALAGFGFTRRRNKKI